ncbi:MAG: SAF domain-containing protein [Thermoleophilaceae bacterium]
MSASARRRRGFLLLLVAGLAGSMAASRVRGQERSVRSQVGPLVPVVIARAPIAARTRIGPGDVDARLAIARIPSRFVPPGAVSNPLRAIGTTAAIDIPRGAYLTKAALAPPRDPRTALRRGERAIDVEVSGGARLAALGGPGARVDVVVTSEPRNGPPRAFVAADGAELLALRRGDGGHAVATLRVPVRQAVFLTAATSFGRDARLLVRSPGDRSSAGRIGFTAPGM